MFARCRGHSQLVSKVSYCGTGKLETNSAEYELNGRINIMMTNDS
jgi:hypothetical protein